MKRSTLRADAVPFQAPPRFQQHNSSMHYPIWNANTNTYPPASYGSAASEPMMFGSVPAMPSLPATLPESAPQVLFNGSYIAGKLDADKSCLKSDAVTDSSDSSGLGSASSSSRSSLPSTASLGSSIISQRIYSRHPATTHWHWQSVQVTNFPTVLGKYAIPVPSLPVASDAQKVVEVSPHLSSYDHKQRVSWVIGTDPGEASNYGKRLSYDNFFDLGVKPPQHTIFIVVGLDTNAARGFPNLEPEIGMLLVAFPISSPEVSCSPHFPQGQIRSLDVHDVLNGVRMGMKRLIPTECWAELSLHQKYVLAQRLSTRRPERERLAGIDFLAAAVLLESKQHELEKAGVGEIPDALTQAHIRLNSYVFCACKPDYCLQVCDFLGDKKHFKGLKWMNWKTHGEIETFFLCVA